MDLASETVTERNDLFPSEIRQSSHLIESENGDHILILESNISSAEMHVYNANRDKIIASTDNFTVPGPSGSFNDGIADISSAARLLVNLTYNLRVFDFKFEIVADLTDHKANGVAFSTDGTLLFAFVDSQNQGAWL